MALYIHPENQKLLWNAIIKSPRFISLESKEIWFKNIIQHFYESNRHVQLNGNALLQLNRDTIQLMMNQLKSMIEPAASINVNSNSESFTGSTASRNETLYSDTSRPVYNKNETRDYILGQKQEMLTKQFSSKQQEYNSMLLKETPKDVNFKETQLDTPISNIDELIKKHIMERDAELKKYAPPPPHGTGTTTGKDTGTGILKIDSAASEPVLENIIEFKDTSRRVKFESEVIKNSLEGLSPTLISKIKDEIRDEIRKEIQAEFTKLRLEFSGKTVESVPKSNDSLENIPETNFNMVSILS